MKILLVDDHAVIRRMLRKTIEARTTFRIVGEASNGHEALEVARAEQPDVVIMDVRMPGMDGIEATKAIKETFPKMIVLAFSATDDKPSVDAMMEAGASGYIIKGDSPEDLMYSLRALPTTDMWTASRS